MVWVQRSRGPDHEAVLAIKGTQTECILGHNRLSIIDLSSEANQPMWDGTNRYCLSYNGEIYNYAELRKELQALGHSFRTTSDSEVLIESFKQWGIDCVLRFNGMFVFALFDAHEEKLWICRDRFGVKPCYLHRTSKGVVFASTSGALAKCVGLPPNLEYVARGIRYNVFEDSGDISPFMGVMALPAGHYLLLSPIGNRIEETLVRYYDLQENANRMVESLEKMSARSQVEAVSHLMQDAVRLRLRADVPVAISLSGGLDSSTIAALANGPEASVSGFTFGHFDATSSEGPTVQRLANYLSMEIDYIWPPLNRFSEVFWKVVDSQDGPFHGGSVIAQYLVYQRARAMGFKVILGGQGADEVFMGYRKFQIFRFQQLMASRNYVDALGFSFGFLPLALSEFSQLPAYWHQRFRYRAVGRESSILNLPPPNPLSLSYDVMKPLRHRQARDILDFSLPTLLRFEDRNSMGNSVESRLPFMDYRLVELGLALPEAAKVKKGFGKWIIRQSTKGKIPDQIRLARSKRGFNVPQASWIKGGLGDSLRERLNGHKSAIREFVKHSDFDKAFSEQQLQEKPALFTEAVALAWLGSTIDRKPIREVRSSEIRHTVL